MPEDGEQPFLGCLGEEVVELKHERGNHHLGQLGVREPNALGALYARDRGAVDVDEGAAVGVGDPRDGGEDYGDLVVNDVPVGEAEFRCLDEAVAGWLGGRRHAPKFIEGRFE